MRTLLASLAIATVVGLAGAQPREGTYRPAGGSPTQWRVNEHHTLFWADEPYLPVGVRFSGAPAQLGALERAGIRDVLLELPAVGADWSATFAAAEAARLRYLLCINSLAPGARGIVVEPQGYRIGGITSKRRLTIPLPGATRALIVFMTERDSVIETTATLPVKDGRVELDVDPKNDLEHVLLLYPEMTSLDLPDFWEGFDRHRDDLIGSLRASPPGPGLRGIVNPMGSVVRLATRDAGTVPTSPYFLDEFETYLETRYRNVETNQRAWSMSTSPIDSFAGMARLVPLWNGSKGVSQLWDPVDGQFYRCNSKLSTIWLDLRAVIGSTAARRYNRLAASIRAVCDVPIVQEWAGWAAPYESRRPSVDGLGMRSTGSSPSSIASSAGRAASSLLRWASPGWLTATDVDLAGSPDPAAELPAVLDDLSSLGARAWFVRSGQSALNQAVADEAARRAGDASFAQWSPIPIFFPENATNPAVAQRLPGGRWWLPSPANGNRVDYGSEYFGYRYEDGGTSFIAIWTSHGSERVLLRMLDPKNVRIESADGSDPQPKNNKKGIEVTLSDVPLIVSGTAEIPVPEPALAETVQAFDRLLGIAEAKGRDATEQRFFFRDALNGFERNPSGSFATLRQQVVKLTLNLAPYTWIEAESSREHTFSETVAAPGCSAGSVLALRSQIYPGQGGYYAEYTLPVRSTEDQDVWIAASVPSGSHSVIRVEVGGQLLSALGESVGRYGSGFGWYHFGTTRLGGGTQKLRVIVDAPDGADIAIDAILLRPGSAAPSGVFPPAIVGGS